MSPKIPEDGMTVAICCHNSAARLPQALRHLQAQRVPEELPWEVLVIDNASTDHTAEVATSFWAERPVTTLRVIKEPAPGLSNARLAAFRHASHSSVGFVDDDNWAAENWVATASAFMTAHPNAGAVGGFNELASEVPPPEWFAGLHGFHAIGAPSGMHHVDHPTALDPTKGLPPGAGLVIRKAAFEQLLEDDFSFQSLDRRGASLSGGGDLEISWALALVGWEIWYHPGLRLRHFQEAGRFDFARAKRLMSSLHASLAHLDGYGFAFDSIREGRIHDGGVRWCWWWRLASQARSVARSWFALLCHRPPESTPEQRRLRLAWDWGRAEALVSMRSGYRKNIRNVLGSVWFSKGFQSSRLRRSGDLNKPTDGRAAPTREAE